MGELQIADYNNCRFFRLSTNCPQCDKRFINPSSPLIITGLCLSCQHSNISYEWKLFHLGESKLQNDEKCKANLPASTDMTSTQSPFSTLASATTPNSQIPEPEAGHESLFSSAKFSSGDICENPDVMMSPTKVLNSPDVGSGGGGGSSSGMSGGITNTTKRPAITSTKAPTTDGDDPSSPYEFTYDPTRVPRNEKNYSKFNTTDGDDSRSPYENILDPETVPWNAKKYPKFNARTPFFIGLPSSKTSTGTKHPNLVLLGNYLPAGRAFMVAFVVTDQNNGRQGIARIYIKTNAIHDCGFCQVTPGLGSALDTPFEINCKDWFVVVRQSSGAQEPCHAICYLFNKLKLFSHQVNSKNSVSVLFYYLDFEIVSCVCCNGTLGVRDFSWTCRPAADAELKRLRRTHARAVSARENKTPGTKGIATHDNKSQNLITRMKKVGHNCHGLCSLMKLV